MESNAAAPSGHETPVAAAPMLAAAVALLARLAESKPHYLPVLLDLMQRQVGGPRAASPATVRVLKLPPAQENA